MKCPHCSTPISLFSPAFKTQGRTKTCPTCGESMELGVLPLRFTLGFLPVALLAIAFGVSGPISAGIAGGVGAVVGMGFKPVKR